MEINGNTCQYFNGLFLSHLLQVHATDPECGASAPVSYEMVRNGDAPPEFQIGESTGKICIQPPGLDYERNSSYQFLVRAVDRGVCVCMCVCVCVCE